MKRCDQRMDIRMKGVGVSGFIIDSSVLVNAVGIVRYVHVCIATIVSSTELAITLLINFW
jgi:hypothetical protein